MAADRLQARKIPVSYTHLDVYKRQRYVHTDDPGIRNRRVEFVTPVTLRTGLSFARGPLRANINWAFTAEHFTDARLMPISAKVSRMSSRS